ncbi:hypothetical protein J15TS10_01300 [Paenibacillus woosongensis]|uniref:ABC transporter permease n=2 Tax=Paenibacillus woosongensis TaxID=307580 RepID=A0ABQ4MJZ4_9BACL|nr:hypothetical protein J15TS10_01300 [Paenibacillus woosongensis]
MIYYYNRPFLNQYLYHSRAKLLIWILLLGIAIPIYFSEKFGNIFMEADLSKKILFIAAESLLVGLLRAMNDLPSQMYMQKNLMLFHSSGISNFQLIMGQWLSRMPLYLWAALILTIPLTSGLGMADKLTTGVLLFVIGFAAEMTVDLVCRYLMIITMYYIPAIVKGFVGIATIGYLALFGFIIWVLVSLESVSSVFWSQFEQIMYPVAAVCGAGVIVLLLLTGKMGELYYEGWLRFVENDKRIQNKDSGISHLISTPQNAVMIKDWILIIKNKITLVRVGLWLIGMIAAIVLTKIGMFNSFLTGQNTPAYVFGFVVLYTMLAFGEIVSALYQQEKQSYLLYFMSGTKGRHIFTAKFITSILLVVVPVLIGYPVVALFLQIDGLVILQTLVWCVSITMGAILLQLGIASLDRKGGQAVMMIIKEEDSNGMLEQVPQSPIPILSSFAGLIYTLIAVALYWFNLHYLFSVLLFLPCLAMFGLGVRASEYR